MTQLFVNNFRTRLAAPLAANATVMYLESAAGLPAMAPSDNNTLNVTLFRGDGYKENGWEVVTITSRVGTACTVIRSTEGAAASLFAVENTVVEARLTAGSLNRFKDSWLPLNGGSLIGPLSASYLMSSGAGAAQPRVWMNQTGYGEPCLALARWTGQGENDSTWRFTNNNGVLQMEYTATGRLGSQTTFVSAMTLTLAGNLTTRSITAARLPIATLNTTTGAGWWKIAKIKLGLQGGDIVIRVSGTTSYDAKPTSSSGSLTTILARIDNDNQVRGSFHTEVPHAFSAPADVIFGTDGTVYLLAPNFLQLSVHVDAHPQCWDPQAIVFHSSTITPPEGNYAIKQWGLRLGNEGQSLHVTTADISSTCNIRARHLMPTADNVYDIGTPAARYRTIYAGTGQISTSDARAKRDFRDLTAAEIEAARDIARAIGVYRWKDSVEAKAADAREHIGPTVQRAIEIMEQHGLQPYNYGFICHDAWDREVIEHPAVPASAAVPATDEVPAVVDEDGMVLSESVPAFAGVPAFGGHEAYTEVIREAGDRYAFRYDELNMFLVAGQEARLTALETR